MIKRTALAAAALTLLTAPGQAAEPAPTRGQAKLAEILDGRVAGEPQRCIRTIGSRSLQQIEDTALVYRDGDTVWVNYTRNPESIDDDDVMVIRKFSATSLCRTDQVELIDRLNGFLTGVLFLDDFVPYKKTDAGG